MNKIVRALCQALGAAMVLSGVFCISGCVQTDGLETQDDGVTVTLRLDEAFQEKAYVRLNHDGSQEDYWYYQVTEDLDADADSLLKAALAADLMDDGEIVGNVGTNKNITLEGLNAKTYYKVVAARILPSGSLVGNVAELEFRTLRDPAVFEKYEGWSVDYKERRAAQNDPNDESEVFACTVTGDTTEAYVPCLLSKEDFEKSYKSDIRTCFEDYVAYRNLSNAKWPTLVRYSSSEHLEDRLRHGEYVVFMIGIDEQGNLTGYYARKDLTIRQEKESEAYLKWVGNWTLSGNNGEKNISYPIRIVPEENNLYYRMYGWESTSALEAYKHMIEELPMLLYFDKASGDVYVISEKLPELSTLAYADLYDFYTYGCVKIDYQGTLQIIAFPQENLRIARMSFENDNMAKAYPESISFELYGEQYYEDFVSFNYSFTLSLYPGNLASATANAEVPEISTIVLER